MPNPKLPHILQSAEKYKKQLLRQNDAAMRDLARIYTSSWKVLRPKFDRVTELIAESNNLGDSINPAWIFQQARYIETMWQLEQEILIYSRYAAAQVGKQQQWAMTAGEEHAKLLASEALGPMPKELVKLGYHVTWNSVNREAVKNIIGIMADGSPLTYKFAGMVPEVAQGIRDAIAVGVSLGQNPRTINRTIKRAYDGGLKNSLVVCRTETMRAYRLASNETMRANDDIIRGWYRAASHSGRTCSGCWAQDGSFHTLDEVLTDHPSGRCVAIPATRSYNEILGLKRGTIPDNRVKPWNNTAAFQGMSVEDQKRVLGHARYRLWNEGKISLKDCSSLKKSETWGNHYQPASLKNLKKRGKISAEDVAWARKRDA